ncbi:MAG TPA: DNA polymerase IV [Desulfobacteraceae bacterium]|nr:DNA polymerase IV [Desulfobacteraceae bacterium]
MDEKFIKREILHVDMDAFYASVECLDRPELSGKPVIVGGRTGRGVVSAASYEARSCGVHSAMPVFKAKLLCPDGIFLPARMKRYKEISRKIMNILMRHSPLVEQASVDEAYLDVSGTTNLLGPPETVAMNIKRDIKNKLGLTCSVGLAPNKFLAKIASDLEKPDGLTIIPMTDLSNFMRNLSVEKIPGVGPKTLRELQNFGIKTGLDILKFSEKFWIDRLGKGGKDLVLRAKGIDNSPVIPHSAPKSFSAEETFAKDITSMDQLRKYLLAHAERVGTDLRAHGYLGRTLHIKIKFADFKIITRSRTLAEPTSSTISIFKVASGLLDKLEINREIRLIGLGVSNLTKGIRQLSLLKNNIGEKQQKIDRVVDAIRSQFGSEVIKRGQLI